MNDDQTSSNVTELGIIDIIKHQRNRYPVLLIDKVVDLKPGKSAVGIKNFTYNEWFFPGHFDDEPNVPGFVQVEALVQAFILTFLSLPEYSGMKTNFTNIDNIKRNYNLDKYIVLFPFCSAHLSIKKWPYYNKLIELIKSKYNEKYKIVVAPGPSDDVATIICCLLFALA